ncbi:hypothetical protein AURDEDRAFT_168257 [Auricularia subglabra TFB-10046 SS5]|nr:hypothetical protein AURDEDRAFT_168257 [Auricularia subglabra TFB-10046 SS5]
MLVIDDPTLYDEPADSGTFVVVAVDPIASTALLDDQAKRDAAGMTATRCLAIIDGTFDGEYIAGMPRFSPILLLAGKGLPPEPYSWAAISVSPTGPHPETGRKPAHTDFPLPWADCYIHTLSGIPCIVSRLYQHPVTGPILSPEEYEEVCDAREDDDERLATEQDARIAQELDAHRPTTPPSREPLVLQDCTSEPFFEQWLGDPAAPPPRRLKLSFEMWMDTSSLDELSDPKALLSEVRRLRGIEAEWARRVVVSELLKRPETEAWLNTLGDADIPSAEVDE